MNNEFIGVRTLAVEKNKYKIAPFMLTPKNVKSPMNSRKRLTSALEYSSKSGPGDVMPGDVTPNLL